MRSHHTLDADRARARLAELGLTQSALASACEVEVRTLQRWFAGQRVQRSDAEKLAAALGVGTAEVFGGVAHESADVAAKVALVMRALGTRESAFAQGLRLVREHVEFVLGAVSFAGHPTQGYVVRQPLPSEGSSGFLVLSLASPAPNLDLSVRLQLGRRLGYATADLRVRGNAVSLAEVFCSRSMVVSRAPDGRFALWLWVGPEAREVILVANQPLSVGCDTARALAQQADLDAPALAHAVCVRPNPGQLRAAALPRGFDRVLGARTGRVDIALDW